MRNDSTVFVALDVHQKSIVGAYAVDAGAVEDLGQVGSGPVNVPHDNDSRPGGTLRRHARRLSSGEDQNAGREEPGESAAQSVALEWSCSLMASRHVRGIITVTVG